MNSVKFDEVIPDGRYGGKWKEFNVTITVEGREVTGRCDAGVPKENGYRWAVVIVENGVATLTHAL